MKAKKLISVIIPFYKKENFFLYAYKSALNQSYKNIEIIIICDDPDLKAINFLKKNLRENNTKVFFNKKNYGVSYCRNLGIKKSSGDYIAFLDSDDLWKKNKLKLQILWMIKNNIKISHTSYEIINDHNVKIGKQTAKNKLNYNELLKCCYIGTSTVIAKKKLFKNIRFPKISTQEDYITWLKLSKSNTIYGLKNNLSFWRKSKNSLSGNIITKLLNGFLVYYKYQKKNIFLAVISLIIMIYHSFKKKIDNYFNAI